MNYTFRAKQEGRVPEESQESNILFGSQGVRSSNSCVMEQVVSKLFLLASK